MGLLRLSAKRLKFCDVRVCSSTDWDETGSTSRWDTTAFAGLTVTSMQCNARAPLTVPHPASVQWFGARLRGRLAVDCRRCWRVRYSVESRNHASFHPELVVIRVHNIVHSRLVRRINIKCLAQDVQSVYGSDSHRNRGPCPEFARVLEL